MTGPLLEERCVDAVVCCLSSGILSLFYSFQVKNISSASVLFAARRCVFLLYSVQLINTGIVLKDIFCGVVS